MRMVVLGCLFVSFLGFLALIKQLAHYRETKLKKAILNARSAKKVPAQFIVRESKPVRLLILVSSVFLLVLFFGLLSQGVLDSIVDYAISLLLFGGMIYLNSYCHLRRVTVCDQRLHYRSVLRSSSFLFEEISKVRIGMNLTLIIYCEDRKMFAVEANCEGYYTLFTRLIFEGVYFENLPQP